MTKIILILSISLLAVVLACSARGQHATGIPAGIEKLHQDDIAAPFAAMPTHSRRCGTTMLSSCNPGRLRSSVRRHSTIS